MENQGKANLRKKNQHFSTSFQNFEDSQHSRAHDSKEKYSSAREINSAAQLLINFINSINKQAKGNDVSDNPNIAAFKEEFKGEKKSERKQARQRFSMQDINRKEDQRQKDKKRLLEQPKHSIPKPHKDQKSSIQRAGRINQSQSTAFPPNEHGLNRFLIQSNQEIQSDRAGTFSMTPNTVNQANQYHQACHLFRGGEGTQTLSTQAQQNTERLKLFGRSSYHVATAYRIHMKKFQESGQQMDLSKLDPTLRAKKMKEAHLREINNE